MFQESITITDNKCAIHDIPVRGYVDRIIADGAISTVEHHKQDHVLS